MPSTFIFSSRIEVGTYYSLGNPGGFQPIASFPNDTGLGQFCRPGDFMHGGGPYSPQIPRSQYAFQFGTGTGQVAQALAQLNAANDNGSSTGTWQYSSLDWDCEYNGMDARTGNEPPAVADATSLRNAVTAYNARPANATHQIKFYAFFHPRFVIPDASVPSINGAQVVRLVNGGSVGNSGLETPRAHNTQPDFIAKLLPYMHVLRDNTIDGVFGPRLGSFYTDANKNKFHIFSADTLNEFQWALKKDDGTSQGGLGANHIEFYYGKPDPGRLGDNSTTSYEGLAYALNAIRNGSGGGKVPTPETNKLIFQMRLANQADVDWWNGKNLPGPGNGRLRPTDIASFNPAEGALASQITFGVVQRKWNTWQHATGGAHIAHDEIVAGGASITPMRSAFYDPEATITPNPELGTGEQAGLNAANADSNAGGLTASGFSVWWSSDETNFDLSNNVDIIAPLADAVIVQGQNYENETDLTGANHWDDKVGNRVLRAKAAGAPLLGLQVSLVSTKGTMQNASDAIHHSETANATGHGLYWPVKYCCLDQSGGQLSDVEAFLDQIRTVGVQPPAPTITLPVSPVSGTTLGGDTITVNGTGFQQGATASIGGSAEQPTLVATAGTSLTFVTPAHAAGTNQTLRITNPDTQSVTVTTTFQFVQAVAAPTVSSLTVATGPVAGGTATVINGTGFVVSPKPTIKFGTTVVPTASVGTVTTTTIAVTSPAGAAGAVHVVVTNTDGQSSTTSNSDVFTYTGTLAAPTVSGVSPVNGTIDGQDQITITGTGFVDGGSVSVGGVAATNYHWVSPTSITCLTPAHGFGTVHVIVTNPDTQPSTPSTPGADQFTFQAPAPTFDHLSPIKGPVAGGQVVTVTGTGFLAGGGLQVLFGANAATSLSVATDGTTITCTTPSQVAAGAVQVTITNGDSQGLVLANAYTYQALPPVLVSVAPTHGPVAGGTAVVLTGTSFSTGTKPTVTVDGVGTVVGTVTSTTIAITTPPATHGSGPVTVIVRNPDGQQSAVNGAYSYDAVLPAPTITNVSPPTAPATTPTPITITGTNFVTGATVLFGNAQGTGTTVSPTSIITTSPQLAVGTVTLKVVNPDGQTAFSTFGFTGPTGNLTLFPFAVNPLPDPQPGDLQSNSAPHHLRQHVDANDTVRALEQILVGNLWLNAAGLGLALDGVTDDGPALNRLLRLAATINGTDGFGDLGCPVILPPCRLLTNVMINVPNRQVLSGAGFETRIIAGPLFTPNAPLLRLGTGDGGSNEDMRVENLTLDCQGIVGISGVYSNQLNESCGAKNVNIVGVMNKGFVFNQNGPFGGIDNWLIEDCQMTAHATATGVLGLSVTNDTAQVVTGHVLRCTFNSPANAVQTTGVEIGGGAGNVHLNLEDIHVENFTTSVHFDALSSGQLLGLTSAGDVDAVKIDTTLPVNVRNVWSTTGNAIHDVTNNFVYANGGRCGDYANTPLVVPPAFTPSVVLGPSTVLTAVDALEHPIDTLIYQIPANTIKAKTVLRARFLFVFTTPAAVATMQFRIRLNKNALGVTTVNLYNPNTITATINKTAQSMTLDCTLIGLTAPAANQSVFATTLYSNAPGGSNDRYVNQVAMPQTGIDTNAMQQLEMTVQFGAAQAGQTVTGLALSVEKVNI